MLRLAKVSLLTVLVMAVASPARAWSNGEDGPNSHGGHDWILDQALAALGDQADWVNRRVARAATDDPDTVEGLDYASGTWWHTWDEWGKSTWGGGPEAVRRWYHKTRRLLEAGRRKAASRALGRMSHMLSDLGQPMHTDNALEAEDRVHSLYEAAVDRRTGNEDDDYSFTYDGADEVKPHAAALKLARDSHPLYNDLVKAYDANSYDDKVDAITRRQLNRAANAVADVVLALTEAAT